MLHLRLIGKDGRKALLRISQEPRLRIPLAESAEAVAGACESDLHFDEQAGASRPSSSAMGDFSGVGGLRRAQEKVSFDRLLLRWTDSWESWKFHVQKAWVNWKFISANAIG